MVTDCEEPQFQTTLLLFVAQGQGRKDPGFQVGQVKLGPLHAEISNPSRVCRQPQGLPFREQGPHRPLQLPPSLSPLCLALSSGVGVWGGGGEGTGWEPLLPDDRHLVSGIFCLLPGLCILSLEADNLLAPFSGHSPWDMNMVHFS